MQPDFIESLGISEDGSLWLKPAKAKFPFIYLEAMEVHWDEQRSRLYSPEPREWSYPDWAKQILAAARGQGVELVLGPSTDWTNIDPKLRTLIQDAMAGP